jgi:hypothetical protein
MTPGDGGAVLRLELLKGQGPATFELGARDAAISIGRKEGENQLVLRDEQSTVSRRHAMIEPTPAGFRIRDLNSRNGVRVQGRPVPADGTVLHDGDEIQLGLAVLRAHIVVAPSPDEDRTIQEAAPPPRPAAPPPVRPQSPPRPATAAPRPTPPAAPPPEVRPPRPAPPRPAARPTAPAAEDLPVVDRLGPFAIHRALHATAGLALEYATDTRSGRRVLVRRWRGLELGFFARRRFRRAYEVASALRHETVLEPLEVGSTGSDTWVLYPPLDGVTAASIVRAGGRDLRIDLAVWVAREACRAVEALGKAGAVPIVTDHDVLVARDGDVRLVHVADAGGHAPDERYAAPEEDAGEAREARSAVFSLGILLYELLVREPIAGSQKLTLPSVDTRRIQVAHDLAAAVGRALEVRPHDRFAQAGDLAQALTQVLDELTPGFRPEQMAQWVASRFAQ